jgi:glycosyltransferase involved in cell wall biosynthesis
MQVSIVIPTYNRVKDLDVCLDSIIVQTKPPKEILIVDDSDNDKIENLVEHRKEEFKEKDMFLRYIRNEKDKSSAIAKNIGIKSATGDIILFLDDDVILDKEYIIKILKVYEKYPNALGVQGYVTIFKISKVVNFINKIFFLGGLEKDRSRILPSTESTSPLNLNRVITVQMVAGFNMSFKKMIFNEVVFDSKLLKYSYKEDKHLCHYIINKYPNSLFMTPYAKVIHNHSQEGRHIRKQVCYIQQIYSFYFFYKNIYQSIKNKSIFLWSRIGYLIMSMGAIIIKRPHRERILELKYVIGAYIMCMKHIKEIKNGDLEFFNTRLRQSKEGLIAGEKMRDAHYKI